MRSLAKLRRNWEGLARADALWSICSDPSKRGSKWEPDELFRTGETEIERVFDYLKSIGISPDLNSPALDFGCGVGRLTRALGQHFTECWGVDIAPTMIRLAEEFNRTFARCKFWLNDSEALTKFHDGYFGFIYTSIVLQHIPRKHVVRYLREFERVLRVGGVLVFQIADADRTAILQRVRNRLGFRRKWKRLLGFKDADSFEMGMHPIPEKEVRSMLNSTRLRVMDVQLTNSTDGSFDGDLRFLDREPSEGYTSKQYCAVKPLHSAFGPSGSNTDPANVLR